MEVRPRLSIATSVLPRDLYARLARRMPRFKLAVHLFMLTKNNSAIKGNNNVEPVVYEKVVWTLQYIAGASAHPRPSYDLTTATTSSNCSHHNHKK